MSKDEDEDKQDADVHDIYEYAFAKQVVKELPTVLSMLNNMIGKLEQYTHYSDINRVLGEMDAAEVMLKIYLETYSKIVGEKGKQ